MDGRHAENAGAIFGWRPMADFVNNNFGRY
jgi:hypothetical protein